jgi:protein-S-isoprenylcysteine O-methyltransferase Ste14
MSKHDTQSDSSTPKTPGVHIPPPLIVGGFLGAGLTLEHYVLGNVFPGGFGRFFGVLGSVGYALILIGIGISLWCAFIYRKARTSILPHTADSHLLEIGPFRWSRNPIYLSMVLVFVGICLRFNMPLALGFVVPTVFVLRYYVIAREENYLGHRFGEPYLQYQQRVRRWI